tara:strand:+ start:6023 stop:6694 length:672 start_codon:yes stop_codon:yes gene_type:complete
MTQVPEENKVPTTPQPDNALMERLEAMENGLKVNLEKSQKQVKELSDKVNSLTKGNNQVEDDIIETARKSAHIMQLPVIEGAPIIASVISAVHGIKGMELVADVKNADGDKFKVPYGCDVRKLDFANVNLKDFYKTSYENLNSEKFELVDIDKSDLTGASKVNKGEIVSQGSPVPQIDRSTGSPVFTGKKVRTVVLKDVRDYTIKFNDKKFTFTNEDLASIRM